MSIAVAVASKSVIIADDTAFVRDRFKAALEHGGHRAVTVASGNELVALVKAGLDEIDLVVVDLRVAHARGVNLVRRLRRIDPERPAIVVLSGTITNAAEVRELATLNISGYVNEYTSQQHILPALAPHLFPGEFSRRAAPRVTLGIPIAYRFGNTIAATVTLNIGAGGVAVRTTSPLEQDLIVKARFRLPSANRDIEVASRIAWSDRRIGVGVEFMNLSPEDKALMAEYADANFFCNRKA